MPSGAVARTIKEFAFERPDARTSTTGRHAFMSGLFHAAQEAGDIPSTVDVDELADVLNHVIIQTILHWVTGRTDEPLEPMLDRRAHLVLYGIHDTSARVRLDTPAGSLPAVTRADSRSRQPSTTPKAARSPRRIARS